MTGWMIRASLHFRLLVFAAAAGVLGVGVLQLPHMAIDGLPEFTPAHVEIQTEALGLSAVEVEQLITAPMEADLLNGVAWLDEIRSESVPGMSSVELVFEPGTNLLRARQLVAERLTQAHALPNVSTPPILMQPLSSSSRVMMIGLASDDVSLIDMSVLARWQIKPRLMGVAGVANVAIWGQREQQLQVQVDPEQLQSSGVSLSQVINTTGNAVWVSPLSFLEASTPGTGGFIDTPNQRIGIQHVLPITTPADLEQVSVEGSDSLRLGDVAQVVQDHQPLIGDALVNDGSSLMLVVEKFPGTSTLEVTRQIEAALDSLAPGLTGIEVDSTIFRPATFLESAIDSLGVALVVSLLLLTLLLGFLFASWRVAVISLVTIPLSLVAAALVLHLTGAAFNTMILAGLAVALAVIIADTVVHADSIRQRRHEAHLHRTQQPGSPVVSLSAVVTEALLRVRTALVFGTVIVVVGVAPIFFMRSVDGSFLRPIAVSFLLAVAAGMLVALTVTPALTVLLGGAAAEPREAAPLRWLQRGYSRLLPRVMNKRFGLYGAAVAVLAVLAGIVVAPQLAQGQPVVPVLPDRTLLVQWDGLPGTSQPEMSRITAEAGAELRTVPGVRNVGGHVGRAITSDQVVNVDSAELWVSVDPAADYEATAQEVQRVVDGYPGLSRDVLTYPEQRIREVRTGAEQDFLVRVFGANSDILADKAEEVRQILAETDGIVNPRVDLALDQPIAEIEVDLAAAQRFGVKPGDVRRAAAALLQGIEVGSLFEQQKVFAVVVLGVPATRNSLTSVENLLIDIPAGGQVRLGDVATVQISPNASVIRHDDTLRRVDVVADIDGRSTADVSADIQRRLQEIDFPLEYSAEIPGGFAEQEQSQTRLWWLAVAAAIGIVVLLQAALGTWRLAAVGFLSVLVALAGGVLAAAATGGIGSLVTLLGLAAVLAVAARGTILVLSTYERLRGAGVPFGPALVMQASRERLPATVVPLLAVTVAFLPLALFAGVLGREILLPLAITIIGGLLASALVTLFVLPALYLRSAADSRPDPAPEHGEPVLSGAAGRDDMTMARSSDDERTDRRPERRWRRLGRPPVRGIALGAVLLAVLALPACTGAESEAAGDPQEAVVIAEVEGSDQAELTLTDEATARLGLETVEVAPADPVQVPYAALLYDADGNTWVFTNPEPGVYVRQQVKVARIDGDVATLVGGPSGMAVVTTGAAELFGAELGTGGGH